MQTETTSREKSKGRWKRALLGLFTAAILLPLPALAVAETVQATHRLPRPSAPRHNARRSRTATAAGRLERRLRAVPSCVALLACRSAPRARVGRGLEHRAAERRGPPGERSVLHLVRQVLRAQLLCRRDQTKVATANREPLEREADGAGVPHGAALAAACFCCRRAARRAIE